MDEMMDGVVGDRVVYLDCQHLLHAPKSVSSPNYYIPRGSVRVNGYP